MEIRQGGGGHLTISIVLRIYKQTLSNSVVCNFVILVESKLDVQNKPNFKPLFVLSLECAKFIVHCLFP